MEGGEVHKLPPISEELLAVDGSWEGESVSLRDAVTGVDVPTPADTLAALNGLSGFKKNP